MISHFTNVLYEGCSVVLMKAFLFTLMSKIGSLLIVNILAKGFDNELQSVMLLWLSGSSFSRYTNINYKINSFMALSSRAQTTCISWFNKHLIRQKNVNYMSPGMKCMHS